MRRRKKKRKIPALKVEMSKKIAAVNEVIANKDWLEAANLKRMQCQAEIESGKATKVLYGERPINAIPNAETKRNGYQILSIAVDSGAAETVIPHDLVRHHRIHETDDSRAGLNYASATGDPIPNLGEQRLPLCTSEGTLRSMVFQAAPVTGALASVKRICQVGHRVVFDEGGSYVENKNTGEVNILREEDGNYILDVWVLPNESSVFAGPS